MANKPVYVDIDEKLKKDYQIKLFVNGKNMVNHLGKFIYEYTYGKKVKRGVKIRPWVTKKIRGVKFTRKF